MQPTIYYCYDAYCGWCYGFSAVIKKLHENYKANLFFEVLSGGMIQSEKPQHIRAMAGYIRNAYKTVEATTGATFGASYLWHIENAEESDWYPESTKPAIALCIFKEAFPDKAVDIASDIQYALHYEGRDLTDDEAYRHLVIKWGLDEKDFYEKLHSEAYHEKARYEFALVQQLQVKGFPCVLLQVSDSKFYLLANGYTDYETLEQRLKNVLAEVAKEA